MADEPLRVGEEVGVGPEVASASAVDDRRRRELNVGVVDRERVADLVAGPSRERSVGEHRQRALVAVRDLAVAGPEAPGVVEERVRERRRRHGVGEADLPEAGGTVALVDLEVVGHTSTRGGTVNSLVFRSRRDA